MIEPFVVITKSGRVQGTISFPELMRMQRHARKLVLAAHRGDPNARQALESLVEQAKSGDILASVSKYLVYEAHLELQESQSVVAVRPADVEVVETSATTLAKKCKVEHPADIPCEDCAGTFVRATKKPRGEARA